MSIESYSGEAEKSKYVREYLPAEAVAELRRYIVETGHHNFSFTPFLVDSKGYHALKYANERRLKLGHKIKEIPDSVAEHFVRAYQKLIENGFDGNQSNLLIRWVDADDSNDVSSMVDQSDVNGGKIDDKSGLNMSPIGSKADDYFASHLVWGEHGVLFLYDGRKMQLLSDQDAASDIMFAGGYGYKPKEGEDYNTALIGTIGF